ncbi:MAG TPA: hypothetical protein VI911_11705 [Patescibacteria group bacterium]|nr:hypothetical protein [Patescibacteria group bacterium]
MENYIDISHGMELWPDKIPNHRENENGIHFLVIYYILKDIIGTLNQDDLTTFRRIVYNLQTFDTQGQKVKGLYDRGAYESLNPDKTNIRTISHDNINSIACFSKILNTPYHKEIYDHGKDNWWRFDNVYPEKPRWSRLMHPRDIIFWSYLANKFLSKFFIWEPMIECLLTCYFKYDSRPQLHERIWYFITSKEYTKITGIATSGKLLAFVRLYTVKNTWFGKLTWKLCTKFINRDFEEGWFGVISFYFKNPDHPINLLAKEIYNNNKEMF